MSRQINGRVLPIDFGPTLLLSSGRPRIHCRRFWFDYISSTDPLSLRRRRRRCKDLSKHDIFYKTQFQHSISKPYLASSSKPHEEGERLYLWAFGS